MSVIYQEDEDIHYTEIYVWGGKSIFYTNSHKKYLKKVIIVVN